MIDLHSHILFGIDDGADTLDTSVEMARIAVAGGTTHMACTPHVQPGRYPNCAETILPAIRSLQAVLRQRGIPLTLVAGADVHIAWELPDRLANGEIPTLNRSRYFLLEPSHQLFTPKLEDFARRLLHGGYVPIITHPERLEWIGRHYEVLHRLSGMGCPLQLTADSLVGRFGSEAEEVGLRILDDGLMCFVASDAHGIRRRTPELARARKVVAARLGERVAEDMFVSIPGLILRNAPLPRHQAMRRPVPQAGPNLGGLRKFAALMRAGS